MTTTAPEPTVTDLWKKEEAQAAEFFARDTAEHQLTVLRDDGLYKHLLFKKPGTGMYHYELVTWPGYLTFCGDMGTLVFSRTDDMLSFFRSNPDRPRYRINPDYWSQKVVGVDNNGPVRRFSADVLRAAVLGHVAMYAEDFTEEQRARLRAQLEDEVFTVFGWGGGEHEVMEALRDFRFDYSQDGEEQTAGDRLLGRSPARRAFRFEEFYELTKDEYDFRFLWACHGIVTGIEQYDAHVRAQAETPVSVTA